MRQPRLKFFGREVEKVFVGSEVKSLLFSPSLGFTFSASHVRSHAPRAQRPAEIPCEKSFVVEVQLLQPEARSWNCWLGGNETVSPALQLGAVTVLDLESENALRRDSRFESVQFNIPKVTLDAYIDDAELPAVRSFRSSEGRSDATMLHLSRLIATYVVEQREPSGIFLRHFLQLLCGHLISEYGSSTESPRISKGGLAPWQKRRALEILESNLGGDLRLARLANECGLSSSYFCRCFRTTFGTSVHKFVVRKRVDRAKELLLAGKLSLAEISIETGFSDQAAFSRAFMTVAGTPPARWRTEQRISRRTQTLLANRIDGTSLLKPAHPSPSSLNPALFLQGGSVPLSALLRGGF